MPAVDAQSLEKDHRSAEGCLKGNTTELQPVSELHWVLSLNASVKSHAAWGINKRS